jgi:hypothetical protein
VFLGTYWERTAKPGVKTGRQRKNFFLIKMLGKNAPGLNRDVEHFLQKLNYDKYPLDFFPGPGSEENFDQQFFMGKNFFRHMSKILATKKGKFFLCDPSPGKMSSGLLS